MPRVNIEEEAFVDQRIELLGELAGYNRFEALGRLAHLWRMCTKRGSYVVSEAMVASCLGPKGPEAIVTAELGEPVDGGIRIKGTETRIEWSSTYSSTKQAAGRARASTASRDAKGRLLPRSAGPAQPADVQQTTSSDPAQSSALSSGSDLSPDLSLLSPELPDLGAVVRAERTRAAAIAPSGFARSREDSRRKLWGDAWSFAGLEHQKLKAEGIDPHARNCWSGMPSASSAEARALFDRIDELTEGDEPNFAAAREVIRNRVLVGAAEARKLKHLEFMTPMRLWDPKSFAIASAMSPEQVSARAGPRSSRPDPDPPPPRRMKNLG